MTTDVISVIVLKVVCLLDLATKPQDSMRVRHSKAIELLGP